MIEFPKRGWGLGKFADLSRAWQKKRGVVFLRGGVDTPMHTVMVLLVI